MKQIGRRIIRLESVDSTNNYTANLVKADELEHGTVILAVEQFAGRGQRGAEWLVKPGENATFSIFLDDVNLSVARQFEITRYMALCAIKVLRTFNVSAKIKWPNDIFVENRKIGGMLMENQLSGSRVKSSIVGIGINVNQLDFGDLIATSIKSETGQFHSIDEVLFACIRIFNESLMLWDNPRLEQEYLNFLYQLNEACTYEDQDGQFIGTIKGVAEDGRLLVEHPTGVKRYDLKEIKFL